ncbi:MAG: hypothetical protein NVS1B7_8540 [Candidatus Saccharimonadales bacterium]
MLNPELNLAQAIEYQPSNEMVQQIHGEDPALIALTRAAIENPEDPATRAVELIGEQTKPAEQWLSSFNAATRLHDFYTNSEKFPPNYFANLVSALQELSVNGADALKIEQESVEAGLTESNLLKRRIQNEGFYEVFGRKITDRLAIPPKETAVETAQRDAAAQAEFRDKNERIFASPVFEAHEAVEVVASPSTTNDEQHLTPSVDFAHPVQPDNAKRADRRHVKKMSLGQKINSFLNYTPLLGKDFISQETDAIDPSPYPKGELPESLLVSNSLERHWRSARSKRGIAGLGQLAYIGTSILMSLPAEDVLAPALTQRQKQLEHLVSLSTNRNKLPTNSRDAKMVRSLGQHSLRTIRTTLTPAMDSAL